MKVISNELRDIVIEGVNFTPIDGGVIIPDDKIEVIKDNFFFKHYVETKAFEIVEAKVEVKEETPKRGRGRK
jgi:hypothetical protein